MKRQTTLGLAFLLGHVSALKFGTSRSNQTEDCLFVQPVISSKVIEGYCGTGKSSLVDTKACDDALTPFLHKSLANRMFKDCDSWCVYDFEKPESIVYRWDEKASCYEAGGAGNPCFGNVEQSMAMDQKKKMCKDASCTQLVTAMSDQLMKRYCGDLRMNAKSCDEENNDAVKKALANKMFSHCGAWCLFDFDDPSISFGWWPESSCWKKGGCEGHPEESGAQQLKANSCELTTTTTTTTSTSTSTTTSTTITSTSTTTTSTTTVTTTTVTTTSTITSTSTTTTSTSTTTTTTSTTTTTTSTSTTTITSTTTTSTSTTTVTATTTTKTTTSTTTTTTTTETSTTTTTTSTSTVTTTTTTSTITTTTTSTTTETTTTTSTTTITTSTTSTTTITSTSTTTTSTSTTTTSTSTTTRTSTTTTTTSTTTSTTTVTTTSTSTTTTSTSTTSTSTTTVTTTTTTSTVTTTTTKAPRETCGICDLENHTDAASWNPVNNGSMTLTGPSIENLLKQDGMTWELMWQSKSKPNMDNAFLMGTWNGLGCWEPGALITIRDDGKLNMLAVINGEYKSLPNLCNKNVLDGEWHHIVATFSQSNKTMRLIVDGCIESELQRTWNPRFQAFNLGYEPGEKGIGSKFLAGPAQRRYKGHDYQHDSRYGRLVFWNRALDPHEISLKHSTACCKTGLVAIYRFDGDYIDALHNFEHFQHAQGEFENEDGPAVCEPPM